jgi:hypothetical protein
MSSEQARNDKVGKRGAVFLFAPRLFLILHFRARAKNNGRVSPAPGV